MRRYGFCVPAIFLLALAACDRLGTDRQQTPQTPATPPLVGSDEAPVADTLVANHLPRLVSHAEASELTRMTLWAVGTDGLRERVFDAGTDSWSPWVVRGFPPGSRSQILDWDNFGADLVADAGFAGDRSPVVVAHSFPPPVGAPDRFLGLPTDKTPFGTAGGFTNNTWDSDDWFDPRTSAPSGDGTGIHVFGSWFDDGINRPRTHLLKASFDVRSDGRVRPLQSEPQVLPRLVVPIGGTDMETLVHLGHNSALHVPRTIGGATVNQTFVFVTREPEGMSGQDGLAVWHDDGQGDAGWVDLGTPVPPPSNIVGRPLAVSWINPATGFYTVNVFVVARREEGNTRWELYERFWVDDGSSPATEGWRPWSNHGSPRWDPYDPSKGQLLDSDTRWRLTTGVTWELGGVVRMNVFGHADPETDRDGVEQPRRLVEYVWDGSVWTWGFHHPPPPSGFGVKTISAAWVNKDDAIRLSVAGRDEQGHILERYYLIDRDGWKGWFWNDLTE